MKHFPRYWPFVRGIHRLPVNSPHKGQWRGALIFSLVWAWTNGWVTIRKGGHLRRHRAHYDVTVMIYKGWISDKICKIPIWIFVNYWQARCSLQFSVTFYVAFDMVLFIHRGRCETNFFLVSVIFSLFELKHFLDHTPLVWYPKV